MTKAEIEAKLKTLSTDPSVVQYLSLKKDLNILNMTEKHNTRVNSLKAFITDVIPAIQNILTSTGADPKNNIWIAEYADYFHKDTDITCDEKLLKVLADTVNKYAEEPDECLDCNICINSEYDPRTGSILLWVCEATDDNHYCDEIVCFKWDKLNDIIADPEKALKENKLVFHNCGLLSNLNKYRF